MKRLALPLFFIVLFSIPSFSSIFPLAELEKPDSISIHDNHLYITDQGSIKIYTLKDFAFVKKFGKIGEGPGEFKISPIDKIGLRLTFDENRLLVSSLSKLSWFSPEGILKKETVTSESVASQYFLIFGEKLVGYSRETGTESPKFIISLYDSSDLKIIESFHSMNSHLINGKVDLLRLSLLFRDVSRRGPLMRVSGGRIWVEGDGGTVMEYDESGKRLGTLDTAAHSRLPVLPGVKDAVHGFLKKRMPGYYHSAAKNGYFPDTFPIRSIQGNHHDILIQTFKMSEGKSEFLVFNPEGKFSGRLMLPFSEQELLISYPFTISNDRIYQLIENQENEEWELTVFKIR